MTSISPQAAAQREQDRQPSGQFGPSTAPEADSVNLAGAENQPRRESPLPTYHSAKTLLDRSTARHGFHHYAELVREVAPDVASFEVEREPDGHDYLTFCGVDGSEIELDDETRDVLSDEVSVLPRRGVHAEPHVKDHDPNFRGFGYSGKIDVDDETGEVRSMTVDVDATLARRGNDPQRGESPKERMAAARKAQDSQVRVLESALKAAREERQVTELRTAAAGTDADEATIEIDYDEVTDDGGNLVVMRWTGSDGSSDTCVWSTEDGEGYEPYVTSRETNEFGEETSLTVDLAKARSEAKEIWG